jgi:NitT/TauT family transport system substrate-binding protein
MSVMPMTVGGGDAANCRLAVVIQPFGQGGGFPMPIVQSRRRFLTSAAFAGAAGLAGIGTAVLGSGGPSIAAEPPPEVTTIRLEKFPITCIAPQFVAEELLRAEGFTDVQYIESEKPAYQKIAHSELDLSLEFAPALVAEMDRGGLITVLAGVHVGCFELFAQGGVRSITDLRGRSVGLRLNVTPNELVSLMASYVGLDPVKDIRWVKHPSVRAKDLFIAGKIDAFLAIQPEPQELRARNIGHVLVDSAVDRPWSQYFCCMAAANTEFVHKYPIATRRALRAILKATDVCAAEPQRVARMVVDRGITDRYDYALETLKQLPYGVWRSYDPEDTMRFYALRLHEGGMIKSSPQKIIAAGTDWRFLNELKRELKG